MFHNVFFIIIFQLFTFNYRVYNLLPVMDVHRIKLPINPIVFNAISMILFIDDKCVVVSGVVFGIVIVLIGIIVVRSYVVIGINVDEVYIELHMFLFLT